MEEDTIQTTEVVAVENGLPGFPLSLMTCFYTDFPDTVTRSDCSRSEPEHCFFCPIHGKFTTGESLDDYGGAGHIASLVLGSFGFIVAVFGTFTNSLIITILRKKSNKRAFDTLLMALAWCDLFCSVSGFTSAISVMFYFQNISRDISNKYVLYLGTLATLYGRSLSSFMTVLIAMERYLVIVFPLKANTWFSKSRIKWLVLSVVTFSTVMSIPRFTSIYIRENDFAQDVPSLENFKYVFYPTTWEYFWYVQLDGFFDGVDFWLPLPLLLLFNGLVYVEIRKFELRRIELKKKQQKDINATKMFVPVVIVLFLCNIEPILHYFYIRNSVIYREHYLGVLLSLAVNSAANLPIYYFKGSSFRREVRNLFHTWVPSLVSMDMEHSTTRSETGATPVSKSSQSDGEQESVEMQVAVVQ